jgi:alkylation response protein AidB-like acyl-CoA dehydrogenase
VGADLAAVETTAILQGSHFVVRGAKRWCTGADVADYILTLVKTDPTAPRHQNLSFLLVDPRAPGVTMRPIRTLGYRGVQTVDVVFDGVRVPVTNLLGGGELRHKGWEQLTGPVLDVEKIEVSALCLGLAQAAFEDAWEYAQTRRQFGRPIAAYQAIRHALADMATELYVSRVLVYQCADLLQAERRCGVQTSMCKLFVAEAATRIVLEAQRVLGAYGHAMEYDVQRYLRDVLVYPVAGGSSPIQRNNIANRMGLPR